MKLCESGQFLKKQPTIKNTQKLKISNNTHIDAYIVSMKPKRNAKRAHQQHEVYAERHKHD